MEKRGGEREGGSGLVSACVWRGVPLFPAFPCFSLPFPAFPSSPPMGPGVGGAGLGRQCFVY